MIPKKDAYGRPITTCVYCGGKLEKYLGKYDSISDMYSNPQKPVVRCTKCKKPDLRYK